MSSLLARGLAFISLSPARRALPPALVLAVALAAAGCGPVPQSALPLPPAFYPAGVALAEGRVVVASGLSGEVLRLDAEGGQQSLRSPDGEPVLRLAHAGRDGALWLLFAGRVERRDTDGRLLRAEMLPAGAEALDLAPWPDEGAFVLCADGRLLRIASRGRGITVLARLAPSARGVPAGGEAAGDGTTGRATPGPARLLGVDGALAAFPESGALLALNDNGAWRVEAAGGAVRALEFWPGYARVSQLVRTGEAAGRHRLAVLQGGANTVRIVTVTRDLKRMVPVAAAQGAHEAPYRGAWDGRTLHLLLGGLDHHPHLSGDGRPRPHRMARWTLGADPVQTAANDGMAARP